jgi:hypothetical protein
MKMSESIANISKALASFQKEVKQPVKDGTNPHFKSKYITLDGTVKAIHDTAPKFGLSYTQMPITTENGVGVVTLIMHESGEFIQFEPFTLPMEKKTAQGAGSGITYAKRYALSAAFGIVSDLDDDGNEAEAHAKETITSQQVGKIKVLAKTLASHHGINEQEMYQKILNTSGRVDITQLSKQQANTLITRLEEGNKKIEEPVAQ